MYDRKPDGIDRRKLLAGTAAGIGALAAPALVSAQERPIKIGHITTASGRSAVLGVSSKRGLQIEIDAFNAAGGLNGRKIQLVERDSKGAPDAAASLTRELIASEGCQIVLDCDSSAAAFAVHEVFRGAPNVLGIHCVSETSQLSADPKLQIPNAFRAARQGIHDSITGGKFAADICKAKGLTRWATISADYSYGRQTTPEFLSYVSAGGAKVDLVGQTWPKLSQSDYTENITNVLQAKPQVVFCSLFGGDLTAFIDQAALFSLFDGVAVFANFIADYTTVSVVKAVPPEIYGPNRYLPTYPNTPANKAWFDTYQKQFKDHPTNWTWEAMTAIRGVIQAMKATGSAEPAKLIPALRDIAIDTPLGAANGKAMLRGQDGTLVNYALGWGRASGKAPYLHDIVDADWNALVAAETEWKKSKGY